MNDERRKQSMPGTKHCPHCGGTGIIGGSTDAVEREHQSMSHDKANRAAMMAAWVSSGAAIVAAAIAAYVALRTG